MSATRVCEGCGERKPASAFRAKRGRYEGYLFPKCRGCEYVRSTTYAGREKYRKSPRGKGRHLARRIRSAGRAPGPTCEVCRRTFTDTPCYDHNHDTAQFRGWLCRQCNCALGLAGDDPIVLDALAAYLRERGYAPRA